MDAPKRIVVVRTESRELASDYRTASAAPALTIRFSALHWFNVVMVLACGLPVALATAGALGRIAGVLALLPPLGFVYLFLAVAFNRAELQITRERITSRLTPFPLWPSKSIPTRGIQHVVATQSVQSGSMSEATNVSWYVVAFVGDDQRPITRQLRTRDEAIFVARTIEQELELSPSTTLDEDE